MTPGLWLAIIAVAFDVAWLLLDWWLFDHGYQTITQFVKSRTVLGYLVGGVIVGVNVVGVLGIFAHFWGIGPLSAPRGG